MPLGGACALPDLRARRGMTGERTRRRMVERDDAVKSTLIASLGSSGDGARQTLNAMLSVDDAQILEGGRGEAEARSRRAKQTSTLTEGKLTEGPFFGVKTAKERRFTAVTKKEESGSKNRMEMGMSGEVCCGRVGDGESGGLRKKLRREAKD